MCLLTEMLYLNTNNLIQFVCTPHSESSEDCDPVFEALVVLEEFCKELAAIAFVKYHHATE